MVSCNWKVPPVNRVRPAPLTVGTPLPEWVKVPPTIAAPCAASPGQASGAGQELFSLADRGVYAGAQGRERAADLLARLARCGANARQLLGHGALQRLEAHLYGGAQFTERVRHRAWSGVPRELGNQSFPPIREVFG